MSEDDDVRFIESGDVPTPEPKFVDDEEIAEFKKQAQAHAELDRIMKALVTQHSDEDAVLEALREYVKTRPDLMDAICSWVFQKFMVDEGLKPRRDN